MEGWKIFITNDNSLNKDASRYLLLLSKVQSGRMKWQV